MNVERGGNYKGSLGQPPFICSTCGVTFKHKQSYSKHILSRCGKGKKLLKKTPEGKKQTHVCTVCNKDFQDQETLEGHFQSHHVTL